MLVSVCIPTASARRTGYFREAIASVAAQTYKDVEVVVGDNSADPAYHAVVDAIMREFPELTFRLVRHPRQIHVAMNLNSLIDAARGEGWVLLPDDDLLCPTFLADATAALARHPRCAFTFADHWIIDGLGRVDQAESEANTRLYRRDSLREGVYPHHVLFGLALDQAICLQTMVLRKEVLASYRFPDGIASADFAFALKLGSQAFEVDGYYLRDRVFKYRVHGGDQITTTARSKDQYASTVASLEECAADVPPQYAPRFRQKLADSYMSLALTEAEVREGRAREHALRSLRLAPGLWRALRATVAVAAPWAISPTRRMRAAIRVLS